jgi:hypothetical protein
MKRRYWPWAIAALPLVWMPLLAQDAAPASKPEPTTTPQPDKAPAQSAPSVPAPDTDKPEPAAQQPAEPGDERLSADNTLSFPVDI